MKHWKWILTIAVIAGIVYYMKKYGGSVPANTTPVVG